MSIIKNAFIFFREHKIHLFSHIPPLRYLKPKQFQNIFFFTIDDIWEKTSISDLKKLINLLEKYGIKGTFFITPYYNYHEISAEKANQFKKILKNHEIAMHGIRNKNDLINLNSEERIYELSHCKKFLEKKFKRAIKGYRSPKFLRNSFLLKELDSAGFLYCSDQFLLRPYPFVKDKMLVIPCHDKCDPFSMNLNGAEILGLVKSKLDYSAKNGKSYVFLMHAYDINEKNLAVLDKIFDELKSKNFVLDLSLLDFSKSLGGNLK
jgi:peptidoglycan/xylan/chitin deacetylase (PgdA/CDA1 family)